MLESLRREPPQQYLGFKRNTALVLRERALPTDGDPRLGDDVQLRLVDDRRFRELLWSLINSGVLVQGMDSSNDQWPWLSVTELGEDYLQHREADVYDPERYIEQLSHQYAVDDVEARFLGQAIAAFHADLPDAAAVMLGATAEHLVLLLARAITEADSAVTRRVEKETRGPALSLLTYVNRYLESHKDRLSRQQREELSTTFAGVASMIRVARNSGGHPALEAVGRDHALVLLRLFPHLRDWAYRVMEELRATSTPT
jgi:hypothetical protein